MDLCAKSVGAKLPIASKSEAMDSKLAKSAASSTKSPALKKKRNRCVVKDGKGRPRLPRDENGKCINPAANKVYNLGDRRPGRPKAARDENGKVIKKAVYTYVNRPRAKPRVKKQIPEGDLLKAIALMGSIGEEKIDEGKFTAALNGGTPSTAAPPSPSNALELAKAIEEEPDSVSKLEGLEKLHKWMESMKNAPVKKFEALQKKIYVLKENQKAVVQKESETVAIDALQTEIDNMERELAMMDS